MLNHGFEIVRWTEADDEKLRRTAGEQCTIAAVAKSFPAISIYAVKRRMKKLGIKPALPRNNQRTDPELIERIRQLAANGCSAGKIEQLTGKTRNAVIGLCHRYRIPLKGRRAGKTYARARTRTALPSDLPPAPTVDKATKHKANRNPWGFGGGGRPAEPHPPRTRTPELGPANPTKSIEHIGPGMCRYTNERPDVITIETPIFCGRTVEQPPYCPEHRQGKFYQPLLRRRP